MTDRRTFLKAGAAIGVGGVLAGMGVAGTERRDGYLLEPGMIYLNHASIGTAHASVLAARERLAREAESNPWLHVWAGAWEERIGAARTATAEMIGARADRLALLRTTTEAMNIAAFGLDWKPGDEVLFSSLNHTGATACFEHAGRRLGYSTRRFDFPILDTPGLTPDDVVSIYIDQIRPETRAVVFPHVDNIVGINYPVARLVRAARERGVEYVLVDAAQAVGMMPVDVASMGVDLYATSAHKWLQAPKVTGLAAFSDRFIKHAEPLMVTWGQGSWSDARKYEDWGTHDPAAWLVVHEAVKRRPDRDLAARMALRDRIEERAGGRGFTFRSPRHPELRTPIAAVEVDGVQSREVFAKLRPEGFCFRAFREQGLTTCRLSVNAANTVAEVDRFFERARA